MSTATGIAPCRVYPRVYGGTLVQRPDAGNRQGLSPRVRGNHPQRYPRRTSIGSIPACTGEPRVTGEQQRNQQVYPRVYGGTPCAQCADRPSRGLSPRVRGNLTFQPGHAVPVRSIPACTGEPSTRRVWTSAATVYPRVYGGTHDCLHAVQSGIGLSPRVRGNPRPDRARRRRRGSIPACTGEPRPAFQAPKPQEVYPRVYGGTQRPRRSRLGLGGLSPRVRGNRPTARGTAPQAGSIPACTGEPGLWGLACAPRRVYPRVYGGTLRNNNEATLFYGLSPRVRGNPYQPVAPYTETRSIPACTGEPDVQQAPRRCGAVYPRVYGGTAETRPARALWAGLSPRVRGNPGRIAVQQPYRGSIPACTGEPHRDALRRARPRVYPRVYGGTGLVPEVGLPVRGLSPRVRGNPSSAAALLRLSGSIPACTGEPRPSRMIGMRLWVYPRVYGGTARSSSPSGARPGLSPRVRGNRHARCIPPAYPRSIPACTGEPAHRPGSIRHWRVYPRVYGGTVRGRIRYREDRGLSPRVRGNPYGYLIIVVVLGSIPACTGEPFPCAWASRYSWVYPRVYGGTRSDGDAGLLFPGLSPRVRGNLGLP